MTTFPDANDPGLLTAAQISLLMDRYELAMAASYHRRGMRERAVFELSVRTLPPRRTFLLLAGLGPALRLVSALRFGPRERAYLRETGFASEFVDALGSLRFTGDIDAMPEGTVAFAGEPLVRVRGPRIEAQLLETLLLNQLNFQTAIATKAARLVLAAGGGRPGAGGAVLDFSPRRDHGIDAAMKVARCAAIAGAAGTSNLAAAHRYGLLAAGTMAHSYVMSFAREEDAFRAFLQDAPDSAILLVDTYDTIEGVRRAIAAARTTGVALGGVRIDSGDLDELSRRARELLDESGMTDARIVVSGDLEEGEIARLVARRAPIDVWGVGTDLGTSRDAPALGGVYKLVADESGESGWRLVTKRSPAKGTIPGSKQVFRRRRDGILAGDLVAGEDEGQPGEPLLVPVVREGRIVHEESLEVLRERAATQLAALPERLRRTDGGPDEPAPYPVEHSARLRTLAETGEG